MLDRQYSPLFVCLSLVGAASLVATCKSPTPVGPESATPAVTDADHAADEDDKHDEHGQHHLDARPLLALVPAPADETATKAFMKEISDALGKECGFCHDESKPAEHHARTAVWMAENFSNFVTREGSQPVVCNTCHQGHEHILPREATDRPDLAGVLVADIAGDKEAVKARMQAVSDALGVKCDYCHEQDDFKKPTRNQRVANWMQAELVNKFTLADGSPLSCEGCHQGKAKIIEG